MFYIEHVQEKQR